MGKKRTKKEIEQALSILTVVGVPVERMTERRRKRMAMALLALANIRPGDPWERASVWEGDSPWSLTTREMIQFWNRHYGERVSSGSYDDVRGKELKCLALAGLVLPSAGDPDASPNDPRRRYAIRKEASDVLRTFGTEGWDKAVETFCAQMGVLSEEIERARRLARIPVTLPQGHTLSLSPGPHNELQKAVIEEFLPRFAPGSEVLYIGDAHKKSLLADERKLVEFGFTNLAHGILPDVIAYYREKNWLLLIEAVHSSNPVSQLRHIELERLTSRCQVPRVYVSVFSNRKAFRDWVLEISWETEVWLRESPDHLIHFNGAKFLGPHQEKGDQDVPS
ncbi:MAG: hypothetical protein A2Y76_10780 [Planctomycetes bacterium RBG_13_60_9]|nr:MAG: hypothetical protein A2Y76_10780 [Planctomycetes bacterium RBG_13_60_9]